jgi:hypothetical protein
LEHPDDVDSLPDAFFEKAILPEEAPAMRTGFLDARIAALRRQIGDTGADANDRMSDERA